ncbi:uncharacterized protein LOC100158459 [Xenopus tropicalis]|uniref:LOC100158459 protein n=1 Tax=Xenopus tropicalis TaxID=8364 RepID=B2GNE8_XENTR|nr:uncharacterized protein LOC100158459 [Xenopus tropicalis]AAI61595.1 LOC100158459 protein [Xenopus tropicalis]|eukprot:NP_001121372.1 uncharacterized protein LOC100158459 [Xenopus tropicalis]
MPAAASSSENPVCVESGCCVIPGLAEPESGCCYSKGLAEAEASPSENLVCVESGCCVIPGLTEPESGCCYSKGLAEAEASPSENPVCVQSGCCVIPGLAEPESGCCYSKGLAEAEASPSETPVCVESRCCVIPGLAEPGSGELAEAVTSPSENPVCVVTSGCVIPELAEHEKGCMEEKEKDLPSPVEWLLVREDQSHDLSTKNGNVQVWSICPGNSELQEPKMPSGKESNPSDQMITPQRTASLVSPNAVPSIIPRWKDPLLCDGTGTGALRKVGWNPETRHGGKNFCNTLWGPLVIGVT